VTRSPSFLIKAQQQEAVRQARLQHAYRNQTVATKRKREPRPTHALFLRGFTAGIITSLLLVAVGYGIGLAYRHAADIPRYQQLDPGMR
jgi:hypothetical protein